MNMRRRTTALLAKVVTSLTCLALASLLVTSVRKHITGRLKLRRRLMGRAAVSLVIQPVAVAVAVALASPANTSTTCPLVQCEQSDSSSQTFLVVLISRLSWICCFCC